jgi:hypothetical protein
VTWKAFEECEEVKSGSVDISNLNRITPLQQTEALPQNNCTTTRAHNSILAQLHNCMNAGLHKTNTQLPQTHDHRKRTHNCKNAALLDKMNRLTALHKTTTD